jgi:hypothetical protein
MATSWHIDAAASSPGRPLVGVMFGDYLDTVKDASRAQWATFTIDVIEYARESGMAQDELLDVLGAFGLTREPTQPAKRDSDGRPARTRGRCRVCRRRISLRMDGSLCVHPTREGAVDRCEGSRRRPKASSGPEAAAS